MTFYLIATLLFFGLGILAFYIWIVADIVRSEFAGENDKVIYLLLVCLLPVIGSILYLTVFRNQKLEQGSEEIV